MKFIIEYKTAKQESVCFFENFEGNTRELFTLLNFLNDSSRKNDFERRYFDYKINH